MKIIEDVLRLHFIPAIIGEDTEYKSKKERMFDIKNDIKKERTKAENSNLSRIRENQISNK